MSDMSFEVNKRPVSLAGRAPREATGNEVLEKAKKERAARQADRQRQKAAITVARWWRGSSVRGASRRRLQQEWLQQHGSAVAQQQLMLPAEQIAGSLLPPVLLAYLPGVAQQQQRAALLAGAPLPGPLLADTRALRGCFALLLRSLASEDLHLNLLGLAAAAAGQANQQAQEQYLRLLSQLQRILLLCCSIIGSTGSSSSGGSEGGSATDALLQTAAARLVGILCNASLWKCFADADHEQQARKDCLQHQLHSWLAPLPLLRVAASRLAASLSAAKEPSQGQDGSIQPPQQQPQPQQQQQQLISVVNAMVAAQLQLWRQLPAGSSTAAAACQQLLQLLATPRLLQLLAPTTLSQLTAPPGFASLLQTAASPESGGSSDTLPLLGVLAQLAAGKKVSRRGKRQVDYLPPSALLQQEGVASSLGDAAVTLLQLAVDAGPPSSARAAVLDELWPFAEGTFAAQLLQHLALQQFVRLYHLLLLLLPLSGRAHAARLLSALAFGTELLPRLWRHLATSIGLPLEAPLQATRGWEVSTLRRGIAGLQGEAAMQLGLFCRVYCHHLQVVDDFEFHEKQQTFTLGQQRAMAAAVNTLVFRTQLPDSDGRAARGAASLGRDYQILQQAAPLLHRALYERDARRSFCPPSLWLEPYQHLVASIGQQQQQQPMSGAAVVRALLAASDEAEEMPEGQAQRMPPAARAAAAAAAARSRPAAVAAILTAAPQCVPFDERVAVFRALIDTDKERCGYNLAPVDGGARPIPITIRRGRVLEDAVAQLGVLGGAVKSRLSITFINQLGYQEAGIDQGGLMKEFLESVVAAGFDPNCGLFSSTPDGFACPNPLAERLDGGLAALETLGLVLGRALYEGVLLDCPLAPFFVSRLQGRWPLFDELQALDPEVYRSLLQLKRYEGAVADLCLDFTVESDVLGSTISEELVPGGSRLAVTNDNLLQYVFLVADWHLNKRLGTAAAAFSRGLSKVIPPSWLRLFSPKEVNQLLGGGDVALDVEDMQAHTQYSNGYSASSTTIKHFWQVVRSMSQEDQRCLLKFVTSTSRSPLGGFKHLCPPLTIHKVDCGASLLAAVGGKDVDRLPSASTCSNTLKLPNFRRASTLREKLLYAIRSGAGFELS